MIIAEARARDDGIDFFVNEKDMTISVGRDENGEISIVRTNEIKQEVPINVSDRVISLVAAIICVAYLWLKKDANEWRIDAISYLGLVWITVLVKYIVDSLNPKNEQSFKYHAAEHKVLNFWDKYQRLPVDCHEVMSMKSISFRCGTTMITVFLVLITLCVVGVIFMPNLIMKIIWCIIGAIVTFFLWMFGCCDFLQKLVVREPSIREVEVAVEGFSVYVMEKDGE